MKSKDLSGKLKQVANNYSATVDAEDNVTAMRVTGPFTSHIHAIEAHFSVRITDHTAPEFVISGTKQSSVDSCEAFMIRLIEIAKTEEPDLGKVQSLMRHQALPARVKHTRDIAKITGKKAKIEARTPMQSVYMRAMQAPKNSLIFGVGPAGTGKTYLAVAHAAVLLERGDINRIILSRPAVEAGERLGFLPGDMKDKVDPYLRPLYDALYDTLPPEFVERAITSGIIEVAPLAFMRGRTLRDAVVILDEAQNTTSMQMKMFLTRLGENATMIVTGDPTQVDLPSGQKSGLIEALNLLDGVEGIHITRFAHEDVVRHPLVGRIVKAYDKASAQKVQASSEPEIPLPEAVLDRGIRTPGTRRAPAKTPS